VLAVDFDIGDVVFEDCWDIHLIYSSISSQTSAYGSYGVPQIHEDSSDQEVLRLEGSLARAKDSIPLGMCLWRRRWKMEVSYWHNIITRRGRANAYINKQVLPQAPSPTMTSLRRISAMVAFTVVGQRR
jgi:hypothetical protein